MLVKHFIFKQGKQTPHNLIVYVVVTVSIDFLSNSKWDTLFYCITYNYSHADWDSLHDCLRDLQQEDIFKLGTSAAASEFCELVQVGIDIYL